MSKEHTQEQRCAFLKRLNNFKVVRKNINPSIYTNLVSSVSKHVYKIRYIFTRAKFPGLDFFVCKIRLNEVESSLSGLVMTAFESLSFIASLAISNLIHKRYVTSFKVKYNSPRFFF